MKIVIPLLAILIFSAQSFPMEFSWEGHSIKMSGEVRTGDFDKFYRFLKANFSKYEENRYIELSSNGGHLIEALKIADLLRQIYPTITIEGDCASACFYLYLSGTTRYVWGHARLGIHRTYYEKTYFGGLSPQDARKRQRELDKLVEGILIDNGVPQDIKERIAGTPSSDIYWLSKVDISKLGDMPAWYEEFMIAKCEYADVLARRKQFQEAIRKQDWKAAEEVDTAGPYVRFKKCEGVIIKKELAKLRIQLKN